MSGKYTQSQLQQMAIQFNQYYSVGDPRAVFMIEILAAMTNNTEQECLEKINKLSMGESL